MPDHKTRTLKSRFRTIVFVIVAANRLQKQVSKKKLGVLVEEEVTHRSFECLETSRSELTKLGAMIVQQANDSVELAQELGVLRRRVDRQETDASQTLHQNKLLNQQIIAF